MSAARCLAFECLFGVLCEIISGGHLRTFVVSITVSVPSIFVVVVVVVFFFVKLEKKEPSISRRNHISTIMIIKAQRNVYCGLCRNRSKSALLAVLQWAQLSFPIVSVLHARQGFSWMGDMVFFIHGTGFFFNLRLLKLLLGFSQFEDVRIF